MVVANSHILDMLKVLNCLVQILCQAQTAHSHRLTLIFCPSTIYDVVGLRKMMGSVGTGLFSSTACSLLNVYLQKINDYMNILINSSKHS